MWGTEGSSPCTGHVAYQRSCDTDGNACYERSWGISDTSTIYSRSLYESAITTRDEPGFGESKLALGVIRLPVTARDRILRCSPGCWNDASRAHISKLINMDNGTGVTSYPSSWGRGTNRHLDVVQPFLSGLGNNGEVHPGKTVQ